MTPRIASKPTKEKKKRSSVFLYKIFEEKQVKTALPGKRTKRNKPFIKKSNKHRFEVRLTKRQKLFMEEFERHLA